MAAALAMIIINAHPVHLVLRVRTGWMETTAQMDPEANQVQLELLNTDKNPDPRLLLNQVKKARLVRQEPLAIQETKAFQVNKVETEIQASKVHQVNQDTLVHRVKMATPDLEVIMVKMRTWGRKAIQAQLDNVEILVKLVILALKVNKVILAQLAIQAIQVLKDTPVIVAHAANPVLQVNPVNVAHPLI